MGDLQPDDGSPGGHPDEFVPGNLLAHPDQRDRRQLDQRAASVRPERTSLLAANTVPTISGTPAASIVAGNAYEFIPQVVDPDGQTLQFTVSGTPTWATFDSVTGSRPGGHTRGE